MEIHSIESFLSNFKNGRARTRRVITCIPLAQFEWTYK